MPGYSRQEVQRLLALTDGELRGLLAAGILAPTRGPRGALRFSFQDLVVLRAAKELRNAKVSPRRIQRALRALKKALPSGAAMSKVRIGALGDELVVRDEGGLYAPVSGQLLFDFGVGEIRAQVEPLARRAVAKAARDPALDASGWYLLGCELDEASPVQARAAYERALAIDAKYVEARINLGRILHEAGDLGGAAEHYRRAVVDAPQHAVAWFNLGVVLEDLGQPPQAVRAYQAAIEHDPQQADAHHNLGHLFERLGQPAAALRHLSAYRRMTRSTR
jgi:tetratricopeptide (TPR) repeat protein